MSWVDGEKIALELMDHLLTQCLAPRWPLVALPQGVDGTNKHFPGAPNAPFLPAVHIPELLFYFPVRLLVVPYS